MTAPNDSLTLTGDLQIDWIRESALELSEFTSEVLIKGSIKVLIRPIRPEDIDLERDFIERLGPESSYNRFFSYVREPSEERLRSLCNIDRETQMALVAEICFSGRLMMIGVGRIIKSTKNRAEIAIVVADEYQRLGLGTKLIEMLIAYARKKKLASVYAAILPKNFRMINMLTKDFGFVIRHGDNQLVIVELNLTPSAKSIP